MCGLPTVSLPALKGIMGTVTPLTMIGDVVAGEGARLRFELAELIEKTDKSLFDIGHILNLIYKNHYFAPYNTFQEYVASTKLRTSKAQYLRKIASVMEQVGIPREEYEPVGITKLRAITSLKPENFWTNPETGEEIQLAIFISELVEKAPDMSLKEIEEFVKTLKGLVDENEMVSRHFRVSRLVADNSIDPAIELAKKQIGSTHKDEEGISQDASDGACWEVIAVSFLLDPANEVLAGQ